MRVRFPYNLWQSTCDLCIVCGSSGVGVVYQDTHSLYNTLWSHCYTELICVCFIECNCAVLFFIGLNYWIIIYKKLYLMDYNKWKADAINFYFNKFFIAYLLFLDCFITLLLFNCEWIFKKIFYLLQQKPDSLLPENISGLWRWLKFFGPKKSLIDSVTA